MCSRRTTNAIANVAIAPLAKPGALTSLSGGVSVAVAMRSRLRTSAILRAAIGGLGCLALFATLASAQVRVLNLSNQFVDPFDVGPDVRAIAFVFVTVDCPISNRYAPEVRRLHDAFRSRGVVVRTVYVNPANSRDTIERHGREFNYPPGALRDPG